MKKYQYIILLSGLSLTFTGCAALEHNYYSSVQPPMTMKQKVTCFIKYIATVDEKDDLDYLEEDEKLNDFLVDFWKRRDADTTTLENEFKDQYVKRFTYANTYLGGWQTDRARVFILHGAPDEMIIETMNNIPTNIYADYEVWVYDRPTLRPELTNVFSPIAQGKVKFVFANKMGFGVKEQVYSTEDNEKVDAKVYQFLNQNK